MRFRIHPDNGAEHGNGRTASPKAKKWPPVLTNIRRGREGPLFNFLNVFTMYNFCFCVLGLAVFGLKDTTCKGHLPHLSIAAGVFVMHKRVKGCTLLRDGCSVMRR